jgi:hypothetical protein
MTHWLIKEEIVKEKASLMVGLLMSHAVSEIAGVLVAKEDRHVVAAVFVIVLVVLDLV